MHTETDLIIDCTDTIMFPIHDMQIYHIAGKFVDVHNHANTIMQYKCDYFVGLIFMVHESTVKTMRIGPLISVSAIL